MMYLYNPCAIFLKRRGINFYFSGKIKTTITLLEFETLKTSYNIQATRGYYWEPTEDINYPYKAIIDELYKLKSEYKNGDPNLYKLVKIIMNGFYGKLIQKIPMAKPKNGKRFESGPFFNPFHASYVTARCRMEAWKFIKRYAQASTIAVMTDGVAVERPIKGLETSKALGGWSLETQGEGVFLGSGMYTIRDPETKQFKTAGRGFKNLSKYNFFELLEINRLKDKIELPQMVRLSLKESLRLKKYDKCNILRSNVIKYLNLNMDTKRQWEGEFNFGVQALNINYDSKPYFCNM